MLICQFVRLCLVFVHAATPHWVNYRVFLSPKVAATKPLAITAKQQTTSSDESQKIENARNGDADAWRQIWELQRKKAPSPD